MILLALVALAAPGLNAQDSSSDSDQKPLRMSMSGAYRPLSTTDDQGRLVGFDADIGRAIGEAMGREVKLVQVEWSGIQASLQAGKEDLICGSMGITAERREQMYFSLPYYVSGAQLYVREGLGEIDGTKVGVTQGTTYEDFINDHPDQFPGVSVITFPDEASIVAALNRGMVDAFVSDRIVGGFYISRGQGDVKILPRGDFLYREYCGIAAKRTEAGAALIREVNDALRQVVDDGTYARLYRKWVGNYPNLYALDTAWQEHEEFVPQLSSADTQEERDASHQSDNADFAESAGSMFGLLGKGALMTLQLSLLTAILSLLLGAFFGIFAHSKRRSVRAMVKAYVFVFRGTPLLVQLFLSYFVLATFLNQYVFGGVDVIGAYGAGLIALVLNTTAYNAETMRGGIASVEHGQWQAAASLGMTRNQTLRRVVLPQAVRHALPSLGNNFIVLIKDTSLVGAITLIELTWAARQLVSQSGLALLPFLLAAAYYLVLISLVSWGMQVWEKRLSQSREAAGGTA